MVRLSIGLNISVRRFIINRVERCRKRPGCTELCPQLFKVLAILKYLWYNIIKEDIIPYQKALADTQIKDLSPADRAIISQHFVFVI